ncbi:MAG: hypothetical protein ACE37F_10000 [Nannocystaceae bacterium]|nr:carboxypeptidase-like regulatory domain-containing protein [bacterium]
MTIKTQQRVMILATAVALMGCGDDGGASDESGSTSGSTSGSSGTDPTDPSTSGVPSTGSTSETDEGTSSTTGGTETGSADSSGSSSDGSTGTEDGTSTGAIESVTLSGVVTDFGSPNPLPGISVCVFEEAGIPCATTDDEGAYTLPGVPSAEGAIEFTGPSRFPSLFWGEGPMEDEVLDYNLLSTIAAAVLANALGEKIDDNDGHLALAVLDAEGALLSGASFTMDPPSGAIGYLTPQGIDPELTATTEVGFAGWLNVAVGEVEVTVSHPDLDCVPGPGALVGSTPDALRIDITAGYLGSTFPFVCS